MSVRKRKQAKLCAYSLAKPIACGTILPDAFKRNWMIGSSIGQGGFGCIYSVRLECDKKENYVAKIEPQENGPLFTEIHFYIRVCSQNLINEWKTQHKTHFLGIPRYVSSGLFTPPGQTKCRFLIMDKFTGDLENVMKQKRLSTLGAIKVATNVLDALEYIHSKDYAHADIKASNLLYANTIEEVYLVDFGLVHLFRINGAHCLAKPDPKYKHNGTLEFCSRDSHQGLAPSRRGDLEILLFNLIHWLARCQPNATQSHCFGLPWGRLISDPKIRENVSDSVKNQVAAIKEQSVQNLSELTSSTGICDNADLIRFAQAIIRLRYEETPNYTALKRILKDLHQSLQSGASRARIPISRRSNTAGTSKIVEPEQITVDESSSADSIPIKRSRCRPAAPKTARKKPQRLAAHGDDPSSPPLPSNPRATPRGAVKSRTAVSTELSSSTLAISSDSPHRTPVHHKTIQDLRRPAVVTPTRSSPRLQASSKPPVSYQRRPLHLHDLFTDSDDDGDESGSSSAKKPDASGRSGRLEPSGRKVLSSLNPYNDSSNHAHSNSQKSVNSRRSACCQTSPELLALAKAEALGRRVAERANAHIR